MTFEYSCFISYRHVRQQQGQEKLRRLHDALDAAIEPWVGLNPYRDEERLRGGDRYEQELFRGLRESVCMILVFTPTYFDTASTFCAREYRAMREIEKQRYAHLGNGARESHSLIIPLVLKGPEYVPQEIRGELHYYDFVRYAERSFNPNTRGFAADLDKVGRYVRQRKDELDHVDDGPPGSLPGPQDIQPWLASMLNDAHRFAHVR